PAGVVDHSFFFFSSRRRHTRWPRDWSSDVCSSDLRKPGRFRQLKEVAHSQPLPPTVVAYYGSNLDDATLRRFRDGLLNAGRTERSEEHTSELQSRGHLVCRLLLEKKKEREPRHTLQ